MLKSIQANSPNMEVAVANPPEASGWLARVPRIIEWCRWLAGGFGRNRHLRRLERDVERLDDRMLADIGLDRSAINRTIPYGRDC
jgi:uncharacterized protein YjiS (DUF1127 family)